MNNSRLAMVIVGSLLALAVGAFALMKWPKDELRLNAYDLAGAVEAESRTDASQTLSPAQRMAASLPKPVRAGGFVSSEACRECHSAEFDSWHDTFHRTMTQVASPESVVAPFNGVRLASRGREYYFTRESDKFYVTGPDPDYEASAQANGIDVDQLDPPIVKREIVMTTGSHHMQGYWVASKHKNMLRQVPWNYLIAEKRWVPREDSFLVPPDEPRHFAVWNDNCIVCHAVGGKPNFDLRALTVSTEVAELGISCEACHGAGAPHIAYHKQQPVDTVNGTPKKLVGVDPIINPASCEPRIATEICGQCHAYFAPPDWDEFATSGYAYRPGGDFAATHDLTTFEQAKAGSVDGRVDLYWNDGTCRVSGREYNAMTESACYLKGPMTCIDCHSMHDSDPNDQLAAQMNTNEACLQCHESYRDQLESHTHHVASSSGSACTNCHMPHTTYGVLTAMRSHRVQSPRVASMDEVDHPNACNLCHLDQTLAWSADKLSQWYGQPAPQLQAEEQEVAASLLWLLRGDAVQRAITAWHMGWSPALEASGDEWQTPFLAYLLADDYSAVRYLAEQALRDRPGFSELEYDYIAPAAQRFAASKKLLESWAKESTAAIPDDANRLLLDGKSGRVNEAKVADLLERQDTRPMALPE